MAARANNGRNEQAARVYLAVLQKAIESTGSAADTAQLVALKAELVDSTIRIAELEEELAAARKPKPRTRRKKKNVEPTPEPSPDEGDAGPTS